MALTKSVAEIAGEDRTGLLAKHPSWERVRLGEIAAVLNGFPFDSAKFSKESGTPLVRIRDVTVGATDTFFAGDFDSAHLVSSGDLLIGMDGDFNSARWRSGSALLNQRVCKVAPDANLYEPRLLDRVLPPYLSAIHAETSSVTVKHLSSKTVEDIWLPLPPIAEQRRLADKLDELLGDLQAGIEELKRAQKKLAHYRPSLLKAAAEGVLTADWRAQNPPQKTGAELLSCILRERRALWEAHQLARFRQQGKAPPKEWQARYEAPSFPVIGGLPTLPEKWTWASAEQLCGFITKGTTPPKTRNPGAERTVPFLRVTNLTHTGALNLDDEVFVSDETHRGLLARSIVYSGDLLMNIVGPPLGQVSVVPATYPEWNVNQAIAIFRPVAGVSNQYLKLALLSPVTQGWLKARAKTTAGQSNLTLELCRALPIPLPPVGEQAVIVDLLSAQFDAADAQSGAIERGLALSAAQRQNILRAAFAGQLVPQDPADEPASALLARIRAERATQPTLPKPRRSRAAKGTA